MKKKILCIIIILLMIPVTIISASSTIYSNVLDDLSKDSNFNETKYVKNENNYTIDVIQVAESSDNELFLYVYQPSSKVNASSINISTGINNNTSFKNYEIEYLNSNSVFFKYKVKDFILKKDALRYYQISAIYRDFIVGVDPNSDSDNTTSEIAFEIGKLFTATTINGQVSYSMTYEDTIQVTVKYVGFLAYYDGLAWRPGITHSHFVAFNTDRLMNDLLEADVQFISQKLTIDNGKYIYEQEVSNFTSFSKKDFVAGKDNLFASDYNYSRIQSINDFKENEDLTDNTISAISECEWVLRFYETDYKLEMNSGSMYTKITQTNVNDVQILRLKFTTKGITYNLGVVDNKTTGDRIPDNETESLLNQLKEIYNYVIKFISLFTQNLKYIVIIAIVFVGLTLLSPIIGLLKLTWSLIKLPFVITKKIFKLLFYKKRGKRT